MAYLFADENFPLPVVEELRLLGHDVVTMSDIGLAGQAIPDSAVISHASEMQRAVLTLNRKHFVRVHGERPDHAGIIVCTVDSDFVGQANRIHDQIESVGALARKLVRVNRPDHR